MHFKKKILNFLKKIFSFYTKYDWEWTVDNPESKKTKTNWRPLKDEFINVNIDVDKVWLRLNKKLPMRWYVLCIFHLGFNRFSYGSLKTGKYGFNQGRLVSSGKKRFRVVKITNGNYPILCLSNLQDDIQIKELNIYPIPAFFAWIKIRNRLKNFNKEFNINVKNKASMWRVYNKALAKTQSKVKVANYSSWIKKIEQNYLIANQKFDAFYSNNFSLQKIGSFDYVYDLDWIIPFKEKDLIPNWAYYYYYKSIKKRKDCLILYADEDCIDSFGRRYNPNFKTKWNRELFLTNPNFGNAWVISSKIWNKALSLSEKNNKMQDFNVVLLNCIYLCEINKNNYIYHLPLICYHSRNSFLNESTKFPIEDYSLFLKNFISYKWKTLGEINDVRINKLKTGYKLFWSVPKASLLSIIIPTKDKLSLLKKCIDSIFSKTCGVDFEILILDNKSEKPNTLKYYELLKDEFKKTINIHKYNNAFNYSKINNYAFQFAKGEVILFLNNDVEFISENWGLELYSNAIRPEIGCVGSKLVYPNQTIQHAGIVLGIHGTAGHAHKYFRLDKNGYQNRISLCHEVSAVTGACMAISKNKFNKIGMFDDIHLKVNFNDVDLCLRAMKFGFRNLYLPEVLAIHHESATRSVTKGYQSLTNEYEKMILRKRWKKIIENDPLYSPYLTLLNEDFSLSYRKKKIAL